MRHVIRHTFKIFVLCFVVLAALLVNPGAARRVDASSQFAVLASFSARATKQYTVRVRWETGGELNTLGFNLYRIGEKGGWQKLNDDLIPAKYTGSLQGAQYTFVDSTIKRGKAYHYKLQVLCIGYEVWSDEVTVFVK